MTKINDIITNQKEENYLKLIAAQNEHKRVLKIFEIQDKLTLEERRRTNSAIVLGISAVCLLASTLTLDIDMNITEINEMLMQTYEHLSSFESLKEYFKSLTPAVYLSMAATVLNGRNYIRHHRKVQELEGELHVNTMNDPTDFYGEVEGQSRK